MNFDPEYISICRNLSPHEFEVGDWAYWEDVQSGIVVICQINDEEDGPWLVGDIEGEAYGKYPEELTCWLPHSESHWMKMEEWDPEWIFSKANRNGKLEWAICYGILDEDGFSDIIVSDLDSLLACAKAWEKAAS